MTALERYTRVKRLLDEGLSYTEVGKILGISRNAVAGLVCRHREDAPDPVKAVRSKAVEGFPSIMEAARWHGVYPAKILADHQIKFGEAAE